MGDFANNPMGMIPIRNMISKRLNGAYVVNAMLAKTDLMDQLGEFFQLMDKEVDSFAEYVRADKNLTNGFNAIGYSQGNLIIRGYIEKYNNPPVFNWVSLHGPLAGVSGFPQCSYEFFLCKMFDEYLIGNLVYTSLAQDILAQANYYRDPTKTKEYTESCKFLPEINNERNANSTLTSNFDKVEKILLIKALEDTMVFPNESEWFGFYKDGSTTELLSFNQTTWYEQNLFGLKTLNEAGKIDFATTPGNHLKISNDQLLAIVDKYFTN